MANEHVPLSEQGLALAASLGDLARWVTNGGFENETVGPPTMEPWGRPTSLVTPLAQLINLDELAVAAESEASDSPGHAQSAALAIGAVHDACNLICRIALHLLARTERRVNAAVLRQIEVSVKAGCLSAQRAEEARQAVAAQVAVGATIAPDFERFVASYIAAQSAADQVTNQAVGPEGQD